MFKSRKEAEHWADENERSIRMAGLPLTIDALKKKTVRDIVERYLKEKTPDKGSAGSEELVLKRLLQRDISYLSLASVSGQKKYAYGYVFDRLREDWKGKPITPRTVRREVNSIQHVFEVAKEEWGYTNLVNPFRNIHIKGSMHRRKRRLEKGELQRLEEACKECRGLNKVYVPLAIYFAVCTGMRLQEIFNLTWGDFNFDTRRIEIQKSKTDYLSEYEGRTIILPLMPIYYLGHLVLFLGRKNITKDARIFPMTKEAFKQSFADVVKRAGINPTGEERKRLTFHDLRREAGSKFDEAGLTKGEHDLMMGHANRDMTSLYIHADLETIRQKLDRYQLGKIYNTIEEECKAKGIITGKFLMFGVAYTVLREKRGEFDIKKEETVLENLRSLHGEASNVIPLQTTWQWQAKRA
jgi:integrase